MKIVAFLLMLLPLACDAAQANYLMIKLMQPKEVMLEKMDGVDGISQYIKQIELDINNKLSNVESSQSWGFLVIAVRNDGKIKAWVDSDVEVPASVERTMIDVAENTKSFSVNAGAVVFAIGFDIGGLGLPPYTMPYPNDWKKITKCTNEDCQNQDVEAVVLKAWE